MGTKLNLTKKLGYQISNYTKIKLSFYFNIKYKIN